MPQAHRDGDNRSCGAVTIVVGQSNVFVNGKLWAVDGDPNDHGNGNLKPSGSTVFINGLKVIVHAPDTTYNSDNFDHSIGDTDTAEGSPDVYAYG